MSALPHFKSSGVTSICRTCFGQRYGCPYGTRLIDLEHRATEGCPSCGLLLKSAKVLFPTDWSVLSVGNRPLNGTVTELNRLLNKGPPARKIIGLEIFTLPNSTESSLPMVGVRRDTPVRHKTEYLPILSDWLAHCAGTHECGPVKGPLPTRVLDLGGYSSEDIRLYVSNREIARYIAFSHCWGAEGLNQIRTTKENFLRRTQCIDAEGLLKSYREVISIARSLGIQYLWIDSLCIMQDDKNDWEAESGDMAAIYNKAYLVIGASCASNSGEGFIASPCHKQSVRVATFEEPGGTISNIFAREYDPHGDVCSPFNNATKRSPLASRGWTLQEQLLSTRMVHFESKEMFWECRELMECECLEMRRAKEYKATMEKEAKLHWYNTWHAPANQYHTRSLTHASDFLPALSGIATRLQKFGAGNYLAGLWQKHLIDQLLWSVNPDIGEERTFDRSVPYRAPTWSWASLERCDKTVEGVDIEFAYHEQWDSFCRIAQASCTTSRQDKTGAVTSGEIVVQGKVLALESYKDEVAGQTGWRFLGLQHPSWPSYIEWTPVRTRFDLRSSGELYRNVRLHGICLGYRVDDFAGEVELSGLILCKPPLEKWGASERAGVWEMVLTSRRSITSTRQKKWREGGWRELFSHVPDTMITIV